MPNPVNRWMRTQRHVFMSLPSHWLAFGSSTYLFLATPHIDMKKDLCSCFIKWQKWVGVLEAREIHGHVSFTIIVC